MPSFHEIQLEEIQPLGRAQLIDSAIRAVAAYGRKGATVRIIANDASVTPGLIIHHFATKARLLDEADRVVVNRLTEAMKTPVECRTADETIKSIANQLSNIIGSDSDLRAYVRRSFLEGTASGASIFNEMVDTTLVHINKYALQKTETEQGLRWTAAQVLSINLAGLIFEPFLEEWAKQSPFSEDEVIRRTSANSQFIKAGLTDALFRSR